MNLVVGMTWPTAAQVFPVGVEVILFRRYQEGRAPVQLTFAGRALDILVGLTAPVVASLLARANGCPSPRVVVLWNLCGLSILAATVAVVATSAPGPLPRPWPGDPFDAVALWPVVWRLAFLLALAVFFHALSLRQMVASRRAAAALASIAAEHAP